MVKSPMVEAAIKVLEQEGKAIVFTELWEKVIDEMQIDKIAATKKIAKLYSDMTLDNRIKSLPDNKWDLKKRLKLDDITEDVSDILLDDEEDLELIDYDDEALVDKDEDDEDEEEVNIDIFEEEEKEEIDEDIVGFEELAMASED